MQRGYLYRTTVLAMAASLLPTVTLAAEHEFNGKVVEVIDGDSLRVVRDGKPELVHLLNIDAPELAQPYGDKAKKFCEQLCLGDQVRVVWEVRDNQGSILATVHEQDGFNVNFEMVKAGMAWDCKELTHDRTLAELEADARKARRGLWADRHPTSPWEFRKQRQKPLAGQPPAQRFGNGILPGPIRF
jgi:endonuclease YncB( thermonuclease family)